MCNLLFDFLSLCSEDSDALPPLSTSLANENEWNWRVGKSGCSRQDLSKLFFISQFWAFERNRWMLAGWLSLPFQTSHPEAPVARWIETTRALESGRVFAFEAHGLCKGRHRPTELKLQKSVSAFLTNAWRYRSEFLIGGRCMINKPPCQVSRWFDGGIWLYWGLNFRGLSLSHVSITFKKFPWSGYDRDVTLPTADLGC